MRQFDLAAAWLCDFVNSDEKERMASDSEPASLSLMDMTEDTLSCILSFLSPTDISACARVCRRLREICREERKVWLPMCERRWGLFTHLANWGNARISYKLLYRTLIRWENLIGFWRRVGNGRWGSLALFEWAPHCIVGHKVVPAVSGSYGVRKIPFLWMGISEDGQPMSLLDPAFMFLGKLHESEAGSSETFEGNRSLRKVVSSPVLTPKPDDSVFPVMDLEISMAMGLLSVDVHFVGDHHVVIEEILRRCTLAVNELAEAATVASFASSHSVAELARRSPCSSGSDTESFSGSPPGSFQYEMYQFLASKVTSAGGERAVRKQKRRDKERARIQGRGVFEPQHYVKVIHACPTIARPLQGLWKGLFDSSGLDFVLVSYDDQGGIVCRKINDMAGLRKSGSLLWSSKLTAKVGLPLSRTEEALYSSRSHIQTMPLVQKGESREASFESCEEKQEDS